MVNQAVTVGTAIVEIKGDDQLTPSFAAAQTRSEALGNSMSGALGRGTVAFAGAAAAAGVLAVGLSATIGTAANFEKALNAVQAATGASEDEMKSLRAEALQVGADTSKSASEAVTAFGELAKAGIAVDDIVAGVGRTTVQLAEATGIDVPMAATLMSAAMNTFGLDASSAEMVANSFARTANASAIEVTDLALAIQQLGPVAAQMGLSIEDTNTALGLFGNNGLRGSDAGTSFKNMLLSLGAPNKEQRKLLDELGISMFDAEGNTRDFRDILGDLQLAFSQMTPEQRTANAEFLVGRDGIRALNILLDEGVEGWDAFNAQVAEAPTVMEQSEIRMQGLSGAGEKLRGSLETSAITIGEKMLPVITFIVEQFTAFVNILNETNLILPIFAGVMAAAAVAMIVFGAAAAVALVSMLGLAAVIGPILLIVAGVGLLVGALVFLALNFDTVKAIAIDAFNAILNFVTSNWQFILPAILGPLGIIIVGIYHFRDEIIGAFNFVAGIVLSVVNAIISAVSFMAGVFSDVFNFVKAVIDDVAIFIAAVMAAIAFTILQLATPLHEIASTFWAVANIVFDALRFMAGVVADVWAQIGGTILGALGFIGNIIVDAFNFYFNTFVSVWTSIFNFVADIFSAIVSTIGSAIGTATDIVSSGLNTIWRIFTDIFNQIWNTVRQIFDAIVQEIWNHIGGAVTAATSFAQQVFDAIWGVLRQVIQLGADVVRWLLDGVWSMLNTIINEIKDFIVQAIPKPIRDLLDIASPSREMTKIGEDIVSGLIKGIKNKLPGVAKAAAELLGVIWDIGSGAIKLVSGLPKAALEKLQGLGIEGISNLAGDALSSLLGIFGIGGGGDKDTAGRFIGGGSAVEFWRSTVARYFPPEQVGNALAVMAQESGGNPHAIGFNANGTIDVGLMQINSIHGQSTAAMLNPDLNLAFAAQLWRAQGWSPWVGARKIGLAAKGAYARAGQAFFVGERGTELFVPNSAGRILPLFSGRLPIPTFAGAGALGGGVPAVNIHVHGSVINGKREIVQAVQDYFERGGRFSTNGSTIRG